MYVILTVTARAALIGITFRKPSETQNMHLSEFGTEGLQRILAAINQAEAGPSSQDLAMAPRLSAWRPEFDRMERPVLIGWVEGHPTLGYTCVATSRLIALDPNMTWARTVNRWYALSNRLVPEAEELNPIFGKASVVDLDSYQENLADYIKQIRVLEARALGKFTN